MPGSLTTCQSRCNLRYRRFKLYLLNLAPSRVASECRLHVIPSHRDFTQLSQLGRQLEPLPSSQLYTCVVLLYPRTVSASCFICGLCVSDPHGRLDALTRQYASIRVPTRRELKPPCLCCRTPCRTGIRVLIRGHCCGFQCWHIVQTLYPIDLNSSSLFSISSSAAPIGLDSLRT